MLEKLRIQNYRSCLDTSIEFQPDLSVLIGPNGSGKTNVLQAIVLLQKIMEEDVYSRRRGISAPDTSRLTATFRNGDKKAMLYSSVQLDTNEHNADLVVNSRDAWYARDYTGSKKRIQLPLWAAQHLDSDLRSSYYARRNYYHYGLFFDKKQISKTLRTALGRIVATVQGIKYYSASQFTNPSECPVSFEIEKQAGVARHRHGRGHERFLCALFRASENPTKSKYDVFFNIVGPDGIGLVDDIHFQQITTSSAEYGVKSGGRVDTRTREKTLVIPQFTIGASTLSPSQLSEGTFKTITLLFYVITEQSNILLIEEPEVCVHHGLLSSIIEIIKSFAKHKQIIISTHSDFVLDRVDPRSVYRVTRNHDSGTQVDSILDSMSADELCALRDYLDTEGNLGEYWRHGGLE